MHDQMLILHPCGHRAGIHSHLPSRILFQAAASGQGVPQCGTPALAVGTHHRSHCRNNMSWAQVERLRAEPGVPVPSQSGLRQHL